MCTNRIFFTNNSQMSLEPALLDKLKIPYSMKASATDFYSSITNACSFLNKTNVGVLKERVYHELQKKFVDIESNEITTDLLNIIGFLLDDVRIFLINEEKSHIIGGGCLKGKCKHEIVIVKVDDHTFFNVEISEKNKRYLEKKIKNGTYNVMQRFNCKIVGGISIIFVLVYCGLSTMSTSTITLQMTNSS